MTIPVNTFQDILSALEQNPDLKDQLRSYILTEELLQLPAQFLLLRQDVDELKTGQRDLQTRMNRVEGRLGNIEGIQYEQVAIRIAVQLASLELGIEGPRVAFSKFDTAHPNFNQTIQAAVRSGLISREQSRDLIHADLIVYGQNRHHAVVEISMGPNDDDISRALRRSEILHLATGDQVTPAIATPDPHPVLVQQAEQRHTRVMDIPS